MSTQNAAAEFKYLYRTLTGIETAYPWQLSLFLKFCDGDFPRIIDLPTGTGKTSLMDVWFAALAWQARWATLSLSRRLVWVVNRRVVVDQATARAEAIARNALNFHEDYLEALKNVCVSGCAAPAISTLRGEKADNREWKSDPSRPAIIIGTVDMIGSRLLFSGYGDGPYDRPQHAGLLGVDALFINDEAHLTPAFASLLREIERRSPAGQIAGKSFGFMSLSATHVSVGAQERFPLSLDADMAGNAVFRQRVAGYKRLSLHEAGDNRKIEARMLELASEPGAQRTIVFIDQPEKALDFCARLTKVFPGQVELLTGTMRGYERDQLLQTKVLQALQQQQQPAERGFLVATSAGEVGIDITCERQISTIATSDHLIQRFGRLNRFGTEKGEAHIVYTVPKEKDAALIHTLAYLRGLPELDGGLDISCETLRDRQPPPASQPVAPLIPKLHAWQIELWCQSSKPVDDYPKVEHWLHGKGEGDLPDTQIAWRADVEDLVEPGVSQDQHKEVFQHHRVQARETITEPTYRVLQKLGELAELEPDAKVLVRRRDYSFCVLTMREAVKAEEALKYALVILPLSVGWLVKGMFSSKQVDARANDIADVAVEGERSRERWICKRDDNGGYACQQITGAGLSKPQHVDDVEDALLAFADEKRMRIVFKIISPPPEDDEPASRVLIYLQAKAGSKRDVNALLGAHNNAVGERAGKLATCLVPDLAAIFAQAGNAHDLGKDSPLWQNTMGNRDLSQPVAKSRRGNVDGRKLKGYRHELGTLAHEEAAGLKGDLLLHLIGSHHGHSRPNFTSQAHDARRLPESEAAIGEAPGRFGRLVEEWGPWGLAYLESVLKAADGMVSREEEQEKNECD